ncbi:MAG: hypothetical protein ACYTBP_05815 [Planctomycetota bacterium]|jgi:GNAT superfamily N-acetyltransferase
MKNCTVTQELEIVKGGLEDYGRLSGFHYRHDRLGPFVSIYALKGAKAGIAGVIVYTMPTPGCELRNAALGDIFTGLDRATRLKLINANILRISRVIVEPRFRGLGLAVLLVRETMPLHDVPFIEAMAVMGRVNPFFERAGMTAYTSAMPARCVQLIEAFGAVGIERDMLVGSSAVQHMLDRLDCERADFIERQIRQFLLSYGKRRAMSPGIERTRYVLSKLTDRPVYYIWRNKNFELRGI